MKMLDSLAIYISSFDGYKDLWPAFFTIFDEYWSNCAFSKYLVNNEACFEHRGVTVIHFGRETNWFERNLFALEQLSEDYIMFFCEDYYLSRRVNNQDISEILEYMSDNDIFFYQLSPAANVVFPEQKHPYIGYAHAGKEYPANLQPSIWHRQTLIGLLKTIRGKTAWDFEYYCNAHEELFSIDNTGHLLGVRYDSRDLLGYKNGVLRGKWIPSTLRFYRNEEVAIETGDRQVMSSLDEVKYRIAAYISRHFPKAAKRIIKASLQRLGIDYL